LKFSWSTLSDSSNHEIVKRQLLSCETLQRIARLSGLGLVSADGKDTAIIAKVQPGADRYACCIMLGDRLKAVRFQK
jgi:hypothetical protein